MIRTLQSKRGEVYRVVGRWEGFAKISVTFGPKGRTYDGRDDTAKQAKASAVKFDELITMLRREGRKDLLTDIKDQKLSPRQLVRMKPSEVLAIRTSSPDDPTLAIGALSGTKGVRKKKERVREARQWTESGLLADFLNHLRSSVTTSRVQRAYAPSTIERYRECLAAFVRAFPQRERTQITSIDFAAIYAALSILSAASSRFTAGTRNRHITALQAFFTWFVLARSEQTKDPAKRVLPWITPPEWKRLKLKEEKPDTSREVSAQDLDAICAGTSDDTWRDFWRFLAGTGLRVQECMHLQRHHVFQKGSMLWIRVRVEGDFRPKTAESIREIPLHLVQSEEIVRGLLSRAAMQGSAYLWPEEQRRYRHARHIWSVACRQAKLGIERPRVRKKGTLVLSAAERIRRGLPEQEALIFSPSVSIHGLRHRYAIDLLNDGTPVPTARKWMGHGSTAVLDRYLREKESAEHAENVRAEAQRRQAKVQ